MFLQISEPLVLANALLNSWTWKRTLRGVLAFVVGASALLILTDLTLGFEVLRKAMQRP